MFWENGSVFDIPGANLAILCILLSLLTPFFLCDDQTTAAYSNLGVINVIIFFMTPLK